MSRQGCNVAAERRLGEQPIVVAKRIDECPTITMGGVVYRDTTDLLYEDTKYKKLYSDQPEYERIKKYERRKLRIKRKKRKARIEAEINKGVEEEFKVLDTREQMKKNKEIGHIDDFTIKNQDKMTIDDMAEVLNVTPYVIHEVRKSLRKRRLIKSGIRGCSQSEVSEMVRLYKKGYKLKDIAEKVGWAKGTVEKHIYRTKG